MVNKKRSFRERLKDKYKLVILNNETFEEQASLTLTRLGAFAAGSLLAIVLVLLTTALLIFTPLREYIPGYTDLGLRSEITQTALKADSLEAVLAARELYISNIKRVIDGSIGDSLPPAPPEDRLPPTASQHFNLSISPEDSAFRAYVESQDRYDLTPRAGSGSRGSSINDYSFFPPVKGIVTQAFNASSSHYGIDIACQKDEGIKATLDGMVIFSGFTTETGNVIAIQHAQNIVSFYKHCSVIFKKVGSFVKSGDGIGVVGNTGEFSTGPHLHFEIWYNGQAVNPADYIQF